MTIRQEVFERLLLAKSLLRSAVTACSDPNDEFSFAKGILLLHDAAECALGAAADHLNASVKGKNYLHEYFAIIKEADPAKRDLPYPTQMGTLNTLRNNIKHSGILPNPKKQAHFPVTVTAFIEQLSSDFVGVSFEEISLKS